MQTLWTLELLHELAADRAADSVLMVKLVDAVSAQSVTTVDQDARNTLTHVVLLSAEQITHEMYSHVCYF